MNLKNNLKNGIKFKITSICLNMKFKKWIIIIIIMLVIIAITIILLIITLMEILIIIVMFWIKNVKIKINRLMKFCNRKKINHHHLNKIIISKDLR